MIIIVKSPNTTVTENNINILIDSARKVDNDVKIVDYYDIKKVKKFKKSLIVTSDLMSSFVARRYGFKRIVSWVQGIMPEESYMRNKKKIRYFILSSIEKRTLKKNIFLLFVSNAMKEHYEKKYKINFENKYIIFPCFNTEIDKEAFFYANKYSNNTFVYAGGTALWQGFENIIQTYSKIEQVLPNSKLLLLVNNKKYAEELVNKYSIKNFYINYVSKKELPKYLYEAKFGFVLREDNKVNNVATPTKISTYLSCGIIPIFTKSIKDFYELSKDMDFSIEYDPKTIVERIVRFSDVDPNKIYNQYNQIFQTYYSNAYYISIISKTLKKYL